jgi:GST-like protein
MHSCALCLILNRQQNSGSARNHRDRSGGVIMIKFYFNQGPNSMKVALFLEESGLPYESIPIDALKGEQHAPEYLKINPNGKAPAIVDGEVTVFDSNAILLYLAEKSGQFLPESNAKARGEMLSWLMFVASGVGPFCGQALHFKIYAPEPIEYALKRYAYEAKRHYRILDAQLAKHRYMLGSSYTLIDMAVWGWIRIGCVVNEETWAALPNLKRLLDEVSARPAAQRAESLKDRFVFKEEFDAHARMHMFGHTAPEPAQPAARAQAG